ncbi:MAG TPA: hypothetical protein VFV38_04000 [Ktedonobacteraceae bacterium]|nr:hypothetical protein [Ktedonobacteraceae bacterium]
MRCINCGLPISPARTPDNCPRCGFPLRVEQGAMQQQPEQAGWSMGGAVPPQNPWGQGVSPAPYNPFTQQAPLNQVGTGLAGSGLQNSPMSPRRPYPPPKKPGNPKLWYSIAGLCVLLAGLLLVFVYVLGSGSSNAPQATANTGPHPATSQTSTPQASASPTASPDSASPTAEASPSATGTPYPAQQYIDGAQMAQGVDKTSMQPQQPTSSFKVGTNMYVVFQLHPPGQGGAVCSYWYLNGKQITSYPFKIHAFSHASYTYAIYNNAGPAYVELYWASDTNCSDKVLAQHVDFTVTT